MTRALLTIALAGLLAGCVRFKPEPLNPAANGAALESRNLADPQLRTFLETNLQRQLSPWPLKSWDFDALAMAAFFYSPSLDVARAQWQVARGGNKTAAAHPNPTMSAVPGYDFSATSGMNPWIPAITFD